MRIKMKRFLGILLTLTLVLGLMPGMSLTAYAAEQKVTFTAGGTNNGITVSPTMYKFETFFVSNKGQNVSISSSNYNITKLMLTDKKLYSGQWGDSYLGASAGNVSFSGDTMTVTGINAKTVTIQGKNSKYATIGSIDVYYDVPDGYSVIINPGSNMTKTDGSGAASQTGLSGAMTDVVYTADAGYYFPTDYSVAEVNGITVTRDSYTQITVSGTPTANATITLTAPTAKTTPDAPATAAAVGCTSSANNDGKLTGVTTAMEYKKSDADSWTAGTGNDITGLIPGTYYVRVKATETTNASGNQELTIAGYTAPTHTHAWATAWSNDVTYHWHACTGEGATDACLNETAAAKAAHTYGDTGDARFTCTVCEYVDATKQAEAEAADLADAKTTATATVNGVDANDYIEADRQTVADAKTTALNAINTATTEAEVTTALTNFNNAIAGCTTQAVADLATAKTNATATVNGVDANDYIEADRQTVTNAKTTALNAINTATTEAEVTTALTNFNNAIAGCTTQAAADQVVIQQVMSEVSARTGSGMTYNGSPIQLINTPTTALPAGYTMKYAVTTENTAPTDDNLYTTSIPSKTDAGTYYVWYKAVADQDHTDSEPACITVEIKSATSGNTAPGPQNRTYDGSGKPLVTAGSVEGGTLEYALGTDDKTAPTDGWSTAIPTATEPGTYYVWYRVVGDQNHKNVDPACVVVSIEAPAAGPVAAPAVEPGGMVIATMVSEGKTSLKLTWLTAEGVGGYDVFLKGCKQKGDCPLVGTVEGGGANSYTVTGLKKGKAYMAYVRAWVTRDGGKAYVLDKSPTVYAYTNKGTNKFTNPAKVTVRKASFTVKVGKTKTIRASLKGVKRNKKIIRKARKLRYISSDPAVATVNKNGKVRGRSAGSCVIYVLANNGKYKAVTVTVK